LIYNVGGVKKSFRVLYKVQYNKSEREVLMPKKSIGVIPVIIALTMIIAITGCSKRQLRGATVGVSAGTESMGTQYETTGRAALGGAAIGGSAGNLIGRYMDEQHQQLNQIENIQSVREHEGIIISIDSDYLFPHGQSEITENGKSLAEQIADVLKDYRQTNIIVECHTDNTGSDDFNERLTNQRATAFVKELKEDGVSSERYSAIGYGESIPTASNDSEAGRDLNRRLEIIVFANESLKSDAKSGELDY
jgi:outer membrane protein OmpA-like peptidoglycan-associated protein